MFSVWPEKVGTAMPFTKMETARGGADLVEGWRSQQVGFVSGACI